MRQVLIFMVRGYQVALSPMMGGACRFEPSCSNYMIQALKIHGALKGSILGLWRILRCHPFGAHGYDPVPPPGKWKNDFGKTMDEQYQHKPRSGKFLER